VFLIWWGIGIWTGVTLVVAFAWLAIRALRGRRPRWRRGLWFTLATVPLHAFVTVPLTLGYLGSRRVRTRLDEARYAGPRFSPAGEWLVQTRQTLAAAARDGTALSPTAPAQQLDLVAEDGVHVRAFFVPAAAGGRPVDAVLVHGLFRGGLELETVGRWLRALGCDVLLLELRNHGGSQRAPATFGPNEAQDVRAAVAWFDARKDARDRGLLLFGVSLGTVATAMAAPDAERLRWLVLDAPVVHPLATARRMIARGPKSQRGRFGLPEPFCSLALASLELWVGVDLDAVRPTDDLRRLSPGVRALVIGAGSDDRVPRADIEEAWQSIPAAPANKTLWLEPDAEHGAVWEKAPERYREELRRLLGG